MSTTQAVDRSSTGDADIDALTVTDDQDNGGGLDIEGLAKQLGHIEKEKFRGKEEDWLPADKFLEKALKDRAADRKRIKFQDEYIQKLGGEVSELKGLVKQFGETQQEFVERQRKAETRGFERVKQDLETEMEAAVGDADTERYKRAKSQLAELEKARPSSATATTKPEETGGKPGKGADTSGANGQMHPEAQQWIDDNAWFKTDRVLNAMAMTLEAEYVRDKPGMSVRDRLDLVAEEVKARFPEKFGNPARGHAAAVARPGAHAAGSSGRKKQKTVADLPEDAKAALDKIKRKDPKFTDEMFLKHYQWDK